VVRAFTRGLVLDRSPRSR